MACGAEPWALDGSAGRACRAGAPEGHLGFIDGVARRIRSGEAGCGSHGTVDIDHRAAAAADEVMVVVTDSSLVARSGSGGFDAPHDPRIHQCRQRVVHRLLGDRPDVVACSLGHDVGCRMGSRRHRLKYGEALGRDLDAVVAQDLRGGRHGP